MSFEVQLHLDFLNYFFLNEIMRLGIPKNYHILKRDIIKSGNPRTLKISIECETLDVNINKLIPRIGNRVSSYINSITNELHLHNRLYHFRLFDFTSDRVTSIFWFEIWELYLNLNRIPLEIFNIIGEYLDSITRLDLMNILRPEDYR